MCNLETEGIKYGCGHYVPTRELRKIDCNNRYCVKSDLHPQRCAHCPRCERYYGPDAKETILETRLEYCQRCEYWFRGPGSRPHPPQQ